MTITNKTSNAATLVPLEAPLQANSAQPQFKAGDNQGLSFAEILAKSRGAGMLEQLSKSWQQTDSRVAKELRKAPAEIRGLIGLQLSVNTLNLQTELLSRAGESLSNTIKRTHQLGSGS